MAISKVIYGGETLIDLTGDTVTEDKILKDYTAHGADGGCINIFCNHYSRRRLSVFTVL